MKHFLRQHMRFFIILAIVSLCWIGNVWADSIVIRPDADQGTNDWSPTNCVDHCDCVNEATVDESDYLSEATRFQVDRWTMEDVSGTLASDQRIDSVVVTYRAKRNDVTTMLALWYIGADYELGTTRDPGASWTTYSEAMEVPGNLRGYWTVAHLDDLQLAINKNGDDANTVDVCWVYVTVYYTLGNFIGFGGQSEDDGQETSSGSVNTNYIYIELMRVMTPQRYYAAFRFPNVTISQGATINSAYIGLYSYGSPFYNPIDTIACEDVDSTTVLESGGDSWDISERWANATSAVVFWDEDDVGDTPGVPDSTPDLKTLVQEVTDRPGWTSGNALTFLFRNMIIGTDSCQYETHSWDGSGNEMGGVLLIEYDEEVAVDKYLPILR